MPDLEKVIKGLKCISGDVVWCAYCPYSSSDGSGRGERCKREAAKDALALLEAQEPRVMTATEAYTADYVYIEFDGVITPAIRTTNERDGHRESYFATQQLGGDWMRWDDYGITWRCWTLRPTDAQKEATPWQTR